MSARTRFVAMISGRGRTLMNLADRIDDGSLPGAVALVIASRECRGAELARARGFDTRVVPGDIAAPELARLARDAGADWIVLGGYLRLIAIPRGFEGRIVNIHPALLPAFGGPGMFGGRVHRAVIEAGCKVSGCTVHLCDGRYDTGPIVLQRCCEVRDDDTPESLGARVFELEKRAYPDALRPLFAGRVAVEGRRARILPR